MAIEEKIFPYKGVNLNVHESLCDSQSARFIKNLIYEVTDTADATASRGAQTGVAKPLQSNSQYIENLTVPEGYIHTIGAFAFKETKQVFVFLYNDAGNHTVYVLNGADQTYNILKQSSVFNFQLDPEYFIHNAGCWVQVIYVEDPDTGLQKKRSFLIFTDGFNPQRQICIEDAIATNGFDPDEFPYFQGDYDPQILVNMGLPTSMECITVTEIRALPQMWEPTIVFCSTHGNFVLHPLMYGDDPLNTELLVIFIFQASTIVCRPAIALPVALT